MQKLFLRIFILFFIFCFSNASAFAFGNDEILSKIENNIYGFDYSKDSGQNRVTRLEKTIYGKSFSGDINKRIKKLSGDISADVIGLEIDPVKDTYLAEDTKEDNNVSYPVVDEIEQKLFNTTYKNRDFHTRIVTIEKKLFGKIYDVDDYSKRMDRIKSKMGIDITELAEHNSSPFDDGSYWNDEAINSKDLLGTNRSRFSIMPFGQKNYSRPYSNFGDFSIPTENSSQNLNDDLAQMEYDMFGTEFSNESTESRIKRLNSVNKAKKSSKKYDSQKFQQHMSTAMEIGAMILMVLAMIL